MRNFLHPYIIRDVEFEVFTAVTIRDVNIMEDKTGTAGSTDDMRNTHFGQKT
jgi:hypothetical protein